MNKLLMILLGLVLALGLLLKASVARFYAEQKEKERLYEALTASQASLSYLETLDKRLAAQSSVIELRTSEIKELYPALQREITCLKVQLNRVQQVGQTAFYSEKQLTTVLKDSIIQDTVQVKVLDYKDEYYTVKGLATADTQRLTISLRDTLVQVVYRGKRKRPYLWIFSKRQLEQRVSLKNPNATIEYNRLIQVKK